MNAGLSCLWGPDPDLCLLEMVGPSSLPSSGSAIPRDSACPSGPHLRPPRLQEPGHPQRSPGPSDGRSTHPFCILTACLGSFRMDAGWAAAKPLPLARAGPLPLPWARQIRARLLKPRGPLPSQADRSPSQPGPLGQGPRLCTLGVVPEGRGSAGKPHTCRKMPGSQERATTAHGAGTRQRSPS